MRYILLLSVFLMGCGGPQVIKRTLETDPQLRVALDPRIEVAHYVQIRRALVETGKFEVVDRQAGYGAVLEEQDRQDAPEDRYGDAERWAPAGSLYGAGSIITATALCRQQQDFWGHYIRSCRQELALVDARTGKVLVAVRGENSEPWAADYTVPDWDEVVQKMAQAYPEVYSARVVKRPLDQYMAQSEERAHRNRAARTVQE
jgi:curli biogenesis system outer membrane secretion channel CsgG